MTKFRASIVAVFLLLALGTALAAGGNSTQITLNSAATVAGTKLEPGTYKVMWTGTGDNLQVTLKGNKTEVKATAKTETNAAPLSSTSYVTTKDGELSEIRPGGKEQKESKDEGRNPEKQ